MASKWIRAVFALSGVYDALLGLTFFLFGYHIYGAFGVPPPNHPGYIQFPALLLVVFGAMFLQIAADPVARRELMLYGMALKVAYCGVVFWHAIKHNMPTMWLPFAWIDVVFLVLFAAAWQSTRPTPATAPTVQSSASA